jgi:hypothetical protein
MVSVSRRTGAWKSPSVRVRACNLDPAASAAGYWKQREESVPLDRLLSFVPLNQPVARRLLRYSVDRCGALFKPWRISPSKDRLCELR